MQDISGLVSRSEARGRRDPACVPGTSGSGVNLKAL